MVHSIGAATLNEKPANQTNHGLYWRQYCHACQLHRHRLSPVRIKIGQSRLDFCIFNVTGLGPSPITKLILKS